MNASSTFELMYSHKFFMSELSSVWTGGTKETLEPAIPGFSKYVWVFLKCPLPLVELSFLRPFNNVLLILLNVSN